MPNEANEIWQPLTLLTEQFRANVNALAPRCPALADRLLTMSATNKLLSTAGSQLRLAEKTGETVCEILDLAPPAAARQVVAKVCPAGAYTDPLLVAGVGYGWLWQQLYALPIAT